MSHNRGLKRKLAFFQSENKTSAVERIRREIELERQKKERLEWYLNEVMQEKEALMRFDELAFLAETGGGAAASTAAPTPSTTTTSTSTSTSTSVSSHTTFLPADFTKWSNVPVAAGVAAAAAVAASAAQPSADEAAAQEPTTDSCERCGRQYVDSQRTCRCRNFESVKKRQRCLSRFVRTGHMVEVAADPVAADPWASAYALDLQSLNMVALTDGGCHAATTAAATTMTEAETNLSDEDFLKAILDEAFEGTKDSFLLSSAYGEKNHRRQQRRASIVEEGIFAASSAAVFGY